jgi:hypothetical protein
MSVSLVPVPTELNFSPCLYLEASVEVPDLDRSVSVVEYAVDMNCEPALDLALRLAALPHLTHHQKNLLNKILANEPQWTPL